jgi:hypothetical protein
MHRLVRQFSTIVTPPFLYGHRHPKIAGLIRFNEDISSEAQRVLQRSVIAENKFISRLDVDRIDLVEIVSDDTVCKSENANLIESGTGVMVSTSLDVAIHTRIPCGISLGYQGVGIRNDSKKYYANQVKTFSDEYLTDRVMEQGGGLVLSCHKLDDEDENDVVDLPADHEILTEILEVDLKTTRRSDPVVPLTETDSNDIYEPCIRFDPNTDNPPQLVGVYETGTLLYGGSITNENVLVDPFVTLDCPEHMIRDFALGTNKIVFSSSDKYIHNLFPDARIRYVVSGKVVGDVTPNLVSQLRNRPWVLRGLLV